MHTFNKRWSPASWKLLLQMGQVYCALSRTSTRAPSWITSSWLVLSWPAPSWLAPSWNFFDLADFRCSFSLTTAVTDSSLKCPVQSSKTNFGENWWSFKRWLNISYLIFKRWLNISYLIFKIWFETDPLYQFNKKEKIPVKDKYYIFLKFLWNELHKLQIYWIVCLRFVLGSSIFLLIIFSARFSIWNINDLNDLLFKIIFYVINIFFKNLTFTKIIKAEKLRMRYS